MLLLWQPVQSLAAVLCKSTAHAMLLLPRVLC
jgi:hypothetical protein